jgi:hypothetical protein
MEPRIDFLKAARGVYEGMLGLENIHINRGWRHRSFIWSSCEPRRSRCAYCIDMQLERSALHRRRGAAAIRAESRGAGVE